MNDTQLNRLAVKAGNGDIEAMWEVKAYFHRFITDLSDHNRNSISSQADFEDECLKIIEDVVRRFNPSLGNFRQLVTNFIKRRLGRCVTRHRKRMERHEFGTLISLDAPVIAKDGQAMEIEVIDRLATVDDQLLTNEKIASLAGSDPRKLAILNTWSKSNNPDSHTADLLAQIFGGKSESHRKFITRLRTQCQTALASAV